VHIRLRRLLTGTGIGLVILAVGLGLATLLHVGPVGATTSLSLPSAAVSAEAQDGMTPISHMTAPGFRLVDQDGKPASLSEFRGKAVVLTFLDPVCWDECPLQAQDMKLMLRYLPASARSRVALVAIAANPVVYTLASLRAFDREEDLTSLRSWHFLTSPSLATLRKVWSDYYVSVSAPRDSMVDHSQAFYIIAPGGQVRYLSQPSDASSAFVGTAELLAAYVGRVLGENPTFPAGSPSVADLLPHFAAATPVQAKASVGVTMETARRGWRVAWSGGYELLYRTTDGGLSWHVVSPAGVTKQGGLYAAFGSDGQAWVVVLPWGYTLTPLTFYTDDWGTTWRYTGVWPQGTAAGKVEQPLVVENGRAYWLNASGLWQAQGGGAWRRVGAAPKSVATGATLKARQGGLVLQGASQTLVWTAAGGWRPTTS
jgi:cytochrome oxidase Cu insertion factor (SCO1/SenC/PrrC family)